MAYMSQERKDELAPKIKEICKKYGVKATIAVHNHSTLVLNVKASKIDFIGNSNHKCSNDHYQVARGFTPNTSGYTRVNQFHYKNHYDGEALEFLSEVIPAMMVGNHNNSDIQSDYFDIGWYIDVNIGSFEKKYEVLA